MTEREKEREDEERSSIQLIKVEDSGISLRRRFLSSTPPSPCLFPFSLSAHSIFCREDGLGGSIKGLFLMDVDKEWTNKSPSLRICLKRFNQTCFHCD